MLETIGVFAAKTIVGYAAKKGLGHIFKDRKSFENRLAKRINETIDEFERTNPVTCEGNKIPFYHSQVMVDELLKFRFFNRHGYKLKGILDALEQNPNIIPPNQKQLDNFLDIFENKIKNDDELKQLEIEEGYKAEIFNISEQIKELVKKLNSTQKIPRAHTVCQHSEKRHHRQRR